MTGEFHFYGKTAGKQHGLREFLKIFHKISKNFKYPLDKSRRLCYNTKRPLDKLKSTPDANMAQLVEHILGKDEVPGSNPGISLRSTPVVRKYSRGISFLWENGRKFRKKQE